MRFSRPRPGVDKVKVKEDIRFIVRVTDRRVSVLYFYITYSHLLTYYIPIYLPILPSHLSI